MTARDGGSGDSTWCREARVIVEYNGDQHRRDTTQYELDIRRIDRAIAAKWTVVRVRVRGIFVDPEDTIRRVRAALGSSFLPDRPFVSR